MESQESQNLESLEDAKQMIRHLEEDLLTCDKGWGALERLHNDSIKFYERWNLFWKIIAILSFGAWMIYLGAFILLYKS